MPPCCQRVEVCNVGEIQQQEESARYEPGSHPPAVPRLAPPRRRTAAPLRRCAAAPLRRRAATLTTHCNLKMPMM